MTENDIETIRRRNRKLEDAWSTVAVGGNHLGTWLGKNHPPYTASYAVASEHYGPGIFYDIWCCWKSIMEARDTLEK